MERAFKAQNLATHAMERAFKAQNLARHEPECLIGCAAYEIFESLQLMLAIAWMDS
jgi:hypothetical protein